MLKNVKLQNIILPMDLDANFLAYPELMARDKHNGNPFCYDPEKKCHILKKYTVADMMTYYNCIQAARWKRYTGINNIKLNLTFKGKLSLEVYEIYNNSGNVCFNLIINQVYSCKSKGEAVIDIPDTNKSIIGLKIGAINCPIRASRLSDEFSHTLSLVSKVCKNHMMIDARKITVNALCRKSLALSHKSIQTLFADGKR